MISIWLTSHPKLIIFDQYKTLTEGVDGDGSDPEAEIIKQFGLTTSYDEVEGVVCGTPWKNEEQYLNALVAGLALDDSSATRTQLRDIFTRDVKRERVVDEARHVLRTLRARGLRLALLSNAATPEYTHATQQGSDIADLFDAVVYSYESGLVKPDPKIFQKVLEATGVDAEDALMVGDSLRNDFRGALGAGISQAVLFDRKGLHPDVYPHVASLEELLELLPDFPPPGSVARTIEAQTPSQLHADKGEIGMDTQVSPTVLRDRGNALFEAKQYKDAMICYGEAIDAEVALNHVDGKRFTSQLYANRSECQLEAGECYASLLDAGLGIQMDCNNFKAHLCKGKAFMAIACWDESATKYDNALDCLEHAQRLSPTEDPALEALIAECSRRASFTKEDVCPTGAPGML